MSGMFLPQVWSDAFIGAINRKVDDEIINLQEPAQFLPDDIRALITLSGVGVTYHGGNDPEWHIMFGVGLEFIETHIPAESTVDMWREAIGSTIDRWNEKQNAIALSRL